MRGLAPKRSGSGLNGNSRSTAFGTFHYRCASFRQHPVLRACGDPAAVHATGGFDHPGGDQHVESPMTMTTERRNFLKGVSAAAASTLVPISKTSWTTCDASMRW